MTLSLTIIILLLLGFYAGYRRGAIYESIYLLGYAFVFYIAMQYYKTLADVIELWIPYPSSSIDTTLSFYSQKLLFTLNKSFYAAVAFMMILLIGWLIVRFIGALCHQLIYVGGQSTIFRLMNGLAGGTLHASIIYIAITLILTLSSLLPIKEVQQTLYKSTVSSAMIQESPVISDMIHELWIQNIQK